VDLSADGAAVGIVDYKTGKSSTFRKQLGMPGRRSDPEEREKIQDLVYDAAARTAYPSANQVDVWFVFEDTSTDAAGGASAGATHAMEVASALGALGIPPSQPVYFAVDETIPADTAIPYFQGVATVRPSASTGCYGSGAVIQALFDAGLIAYGWQSMSTGFADNASTLPVTAIQQSTASPPVATTDANDILKSDFGQYPRPAPAPSPVTAEVIKPTTGRYGSMNAPVVAVCPMPTSGGYTLVGADGGTFNYGTAPMLGSLANDHLNAPIVDAVHTADGKGLLMVATDGGVFALGDSDFEGSMGGKSLNAPVVGIGLTATGKGYWLTAADGGVFAFGDAPFKGSAA
jgi:hypothetical protein